MSEDSRGDPPAPPSLRSPGNKRWTRLVKMRKASGSARRRLRLVAFGVCLCSAIAGISVAASSSPGRESGDTSVGISSSATGKEAAAPSATSTSPSHAPAAPTASAAVSHELASTVLRVPKGLKDRLWHWKAGPRGAALSAVTQQMGTAEQSAGLRTYPQMRLACISLDASIRHARAAPPIPDVGMQRLYGKALAELSRAAVDCQDAISEKLEVVEDIAIRVNKTLLNRTRSEFAAGFEKLYQATAAIAALGRT